VAYAVEFAKQNRDVSSWTMGHIKKNAVKIGESLKSEWETEANQKQDFSLSV